MGEEKEEAEEDEEERADAVRRGGEEGVPFRCAEFEHCMNRGAPSLQAPGPARRPIASRTFVTDAIMATGSSRLV